MSSLQTMGLSSQAFSPEKENHPWVTDDTFMNTCLQQKSSTIPYTSNTCTSLKNVTMSHKQHSYHLEQTFQSKIFLYS